MILEDILDGKELTEDEILRPVDESFWRAYRRYGAPARQKIREVLDLSSVVVRNPVAFRNFLSSEGFHSLDSVRQMGPYPLVSSGASPLFIFPLAGISPGRTGELRNFLVDTEVLPVTLKDYGVSVREEILEKALERSLCSTRDGRVTQSFYFTPEVVGEEAVEGNREVLATSHAIIDHLLEDGNAEEVRLILGSPHSVDGLVSYGMYRLPVLNQRRSEEIFENVIQTCGCHWAPWLGWRRPWFDNRVVGKEAAETNKNGLLASHAFLDYVKIRKLI